MHISLFTLFTLNHELYNNCDMIVQTELLVRIEEQISSYHRRYGSSAATAVKGMLTFLEWSKNFELKDLVAHGSLFTTRPTLFDYVATNEALRAASNSLFAMLDNGNIKVTVNQKYKLEEASLVHQLLETRQTKGSTVLIP